MSVNYNPATPVDGLILCLDTANRRSYPGSGNTWFDISGLNNRLTLNNNPVFNTGLGNGFTFGAGANGSFSSQIVLSSDFCFSMWLNFSSYIDTGPNNHQYFFSTGSLPFGYSLMRLNQDLYVRTTAGFNGFSFPTVSLNNWFHLIVQRNGSTISYIRNSIRMSAFSLSGETYINQLDSSSSHSSNTCTYDNVRVYNRSLSNLEINQLFNTQKARYGL